MSKSAQLQKKYNESFEDINPITGLDNVFDKKTGRPLDIIIEELKKRVLLNQEFAGKFRFIGDWTYLGLDKDTHLSFAKIAKALPKYSIMITYKPFANDKFFPRAFGMLIALKGNSDIDTTTFIFSDKLGGIWTAQYSSESDGKWRNLSNLSIDEASNFGLSVEEQPTWSIKPDRLSWRKISGVAVLNAQFHVPATAAGQTVNLFSGTLPLEFQPESGYLESATHGQRFIMDGQSGRIFFDTTTSKDFDYSISLAYVTKEANK